MRWTDKVARRIRMLFRKDVVERELDEELRAHVEMEAEDLVRRGMAPEQAHREALVRFGGVERTKERVRDERGGRLLDDLAQDLRYGARSLRHAPGYTASALLVLALGIGSATTLFGVVDAVLLEPLPYATPERLVRVWPSSPSRGVERASMSYPDFVDWRERARTLDGMALYSTLAAGYVYLASDGPTELTTEWVAGDYFQALGVAPAAGRALTPEDAEEGRMVAVLSWGAWQRLFGGDPASLGRTFLLDHRTFELVGVMPAGFAFPEDYAAEVWVPLTVIPEDDIPIQLRQVRFLQAFGRLAPGQTVEAAREELSTVARELEATYPDINAGVSAATVVPLHEWTVGDVRSALLVALGAVGFILLLACANVANLMLARGTARARELALRMSLGAPASRVVRQLLTESLLLAVVGGAAGLVLAWLAVEALSRGSGGILPRAAGIELDGTVVLVALAVTVAAAVLAGVLPAWRATDVAPAEDLREGGRGSSGGVGGVRLRRGLVAAEVALAVLLLTGAGLLVRSLGALAQVDPGFASQGRLAMILTISDQKHPERADWLAIYHGILERLEAHPDVAAAGAIRYLPFRGEGEAMPVRVAGLYEPPREEQRYAQMFQVSEGAFEALGIRLLRGRAIQAGDRADVPLVAVVNEAFQRDFFQGQDPVGERFSVLGGRATVEVVGVVADVHHGGLAEAPRPAVYVSNDQIPRIQMAYVVRANGDPLALVADMRRIVAELDPDQAITEFVPLDDLLARDLARPRFFTTLLSGFALLALLLAALGVYGVLAYVVRGRTRELGLRVALGASANRVARGVLLQGMAPVAAGLAAGLVGAAGLARFVEALLFGVEPLDPMTYAGVALVLGAVAVGACLVPAWGASRVDPVVSLRAE
ncbi:MAG: hypothetical protein AMXMBFR53_32680 [Gemmatimonadota bacterium]